MRITKQRQNRWIVALALVAAAAVVTAAPADAESSAWKVDAAHTEINFSINHFFTPVTGSFEDFEVDLDYDAENPANSSVEARIKVASVNTGNEKRDGHLRSADWFEADKHPYMTFKSTRVLATEDGLVAQGLLTIKGNSRPVELPIKLLGRQPIPEPMRAMLGGTTEVASFEAATAVTRKDFGVGVGNWAQTVVVGGEVEIQILLEAHQS
jgi:polyisoprenoid-binding protein YceI